MKNSEQVKYLYRYEKCNMNRICPILLNNTILFSPPKSFNDPFDCATTIKIPDLDNLSTEDEEDFKKYFYYLMEEENKQKDEAEYGISIGNHKKSENIERSRQEVAEAVEGIADEYRILCLSANPKSILMWSHYSEYHKGIALQFDREILIEESGEDKGFKVDYTETFPTLKEYLDVINDPLAASKLFFCRKHTNWKYEQEYRYFIKGTKEGKEHRTIPEGALTGIIFGFKIDESKKRDIIKCNQRREHPLKIYYAKPYPDAFKLSITSEDGEEL